MEKQKEALRESSGYNECMRRIERDNKKFADCVAAKVRAAGYSDGLECIGNYEKEPCQNTTRYNAEINARNECDSEVEYETNLGTLDCDKMLMEAQVR